MAKLAASLVNLRTEINTRWPNRDKKSDGWIGDAAHQARESDHNPDSRGIVHAIDVDKDGIDTTFVISRCLRDNWPTSYVIYNKKIWRAKNDWKAETYHGDNPHTDHIHISIKHGTNWEDAKWHWGIATPEPETSAIGPVGAVDEMDDWRRYFDMANEQFSNIAGGLFGATQMLRNL